MNSPFNLTRTSPVLLGDPVRLAQILTNLISNAIKFTETGSVWLDINLKATSEDEAELDFSVTDTGIGIPADKLDYIFERFTQAESNTTRKFGGTGLGLAITGRLLEMQGSHISVISQSGAGSCFSFTLSFTQGEESMLATNTRIVTETPDSLDHVRRRLVEDNEINRKVATRFLNKWGIWPDYACNGKDALQKVQEKDYDLILMDLQMPEMDGYEASRIIREQKSADGLPIVALTASAMHDVSRQIYAAGMNDFVTKPFHPDDLYRKIARYTSLKHPAPAPAANHEATVHKLAAGDILDIKGLMKVIGSGSEFLEEMILMHIDMFREFAQEYRQIMEQRDRKRLRFIFHRVKAPCAMLSIKMLEEETGLPKNYWMTQKYLRLK